MRAIALTRQGSKSPCNEDAYLLHGRQGLYVVADGVGGRPNGEDASRALVDSLYHLAKESSHLTMHQVKRHICSFSADMAVQAKRSGLSGMATTVVGLLVDQTRAWVFHAGDSRLYRIGAAGVEQLTQDHVRSITKVNGETRMVVTRAVGVGSALQLDVQRIRYVPDDQFLLLSDGISDVVNEDQIWQILGQSSSSRGERLKALVAEAESRGGIDDKTAMWLFP